MSDRISNKSESVRLTCFFGAFVFLQFTVLALANHAGEGYLTAGQRDLVYYGLQVFVILGYLLHGLFFRFCKNERVRKGAAYVIFALFFLSVALLLIAGADSLLSVIVSMTSALFLGGIGGAVHVRMSLETVTGAAVARCMGIGSAAAVLLQYLLQIQWGVTPLLPVFMGAAFLLLILLRKRPQEETVPEETATAVHTPSRRIVFAILIAATFILFACFYNETIHHLMIRSGYASANVYSWPRLMLIPGYLLFALIGDRKGGRYVPLTALCIMLIALLNVVLIGDQGAYQFNMCLFYFSIAAFTSYYLLTFWRLAPGTKHPALWAPFGRMLDSGMVLLAGAIHLSALPAAVVLGADIAGVALVIVLMAISGDFNLSKTQTEAEPVLAEAAVPEVRPMRSPEETLIRMRELYALTPRETDVLRELVLTEDKQTVISERLSIQVKTLQDYVTRLYRKTGASTRMGLSDLYHKTQSEI